MPYFRVTEIDGQSTTRYSMWAPSLASAKTVLRRDAVSTRTKFTVEPVPEDKTPPSWISLALPWLVSMAIPVLLWGVFKLVNLLIPAL